jgi:hypothetical protein
VFVLSRADERLHVREAVFLETKDQPPTQPIYYTVPTLAYKHLNTLYIHFYQFLGTFLAKIKGASKRIGSIQYRLPSTPASLAFGSVAVNISVGKKLDALEDLIYESWELLKVMNCLEKSRGSRCFYIRLSKFQEIWSCNVSIPHRRSYAT